MVGGGGGGGGGGDVGPPPHEIEPNVNAADASLKAVLITPRVDLFEKNLFEIGWWR